MTDPARRAVACAAFPNPPKGRIAPDGNLTAWRDFGGILWRWHDEHMWLPDFDDWATKGVLLGLVREAYGAIGVHVIPYAYDGGCSTGYACWIVMNENGHIRQWAAGTGPSRAEALVAALEAAPKKEAG